MTRHIVLIGAGRSGTKIIRDVLSTATGFGCVPHDVGYVWRYGNESVPHDVLDPASVTPKIRRFIERYIDRYAVPGTTTVIEKSVGNALRVPFVHAVLPDATFIHIIRDGIDVAESTRRQWLLPPDRHYVVEKMHHFPARLIPTYGRKYAVSLLRGYVRRDSRLGTWGVRYPGMDEDLRSESLLTVCARQWQTSVEYARDGFRNIDAPVFEVRYEQMVAAPQETLQRLLGDVGLEVDPSALRRAVSMLTAGRAGLGTRSLSQDELEELEKVLGPTLDDFGYSRPTARRAANVDADQSEPSRDWM